MIFFKKKKTLYHVDEIISAPVLEEITETIKSKDILSPAEIASIGLDISERYADARKDGMTKLGAIHHATENFIPSGIKAGDGRFYFWLWLKSDIENILIINTNIPYDKYWQSDGLFYKTIQPCSDDGEKQGMLFVRKKRW